MAYTLSNLRDIAYDFIAESSFDTHFPAAEMTSFINIGLKKIGIETLYYEKPISGWSVTSGSRNVTLPADFVVTRHIYYTPAATYTRELSPVKHPMLRWGVSTSGVPELYSVVGDYLVLDPPPNETSSATISGFYIATEADLSGDSDQPELPNEFRPYLAHYAAYEALMADGLANFAQNHLNQFLEGQRMLTARFYNDRTRRNMDMFRRETVFGKTSGQVDLQGDQV